MNKQPLDPITKRLQLRQRGLLGMEKARKNAVLVPLLHTTDGQTAVLFTTRAHTLRRQAGEICFPGGHWEPDDQTEWMTAVRETSEELQIPLETIEYVGDLDVLVSPAQMILYPFVGYLREPERITPNPAEVADIFTVPLDVLLAMQPEVYDVHLQARPAENFPYHRVPNGENYPWRTGKVPQYFYQVGERTIWGLTARILHHFLDVARGGKAMNGQTGAE